MKLNKWHRDKIIGAALKHAFDARKREAINTGSELLLKLLRHSVDSDEDYSAVLRAAELGFVDQYNDVSIRINGEWRYFSVSNAAPRPRRGSVHLTSPDPLAEEIIALCESVEKIAAEEAGMKGQLKSLTNSVTTLEGLKKLWPNGEPFYSWLTAEAASSAKVCLPAATIAEIDVALGLPIEKIA